MYDVIIVGGGPSGIICAIEASKRNKKVAIIEKNNILLKKFRLTGNGRSNILNYCDETTFINRVHNGKFLYNLIQHCNPIFLFNYFQEMRIDLKIEDHNRVYPKCENANMVAQTLIEQLKNVDIFYNETVIKIEPNFIVYTQNMQFEAEKVVIATGGLSFPTTGSTGDGFVFAKKFNHSIKDTYPVETSIISNASFIQNKTLQGLSLQDVSLSLFSNGKKITHYTHDLLFTHFGISGPLALGISEDVYKLISKKQEAIVTLDFLPTINSEQLTSLIKSKLNTSHIKNSLKGIIPMRLLEFLLNESNIELNKISNHLSNKEIDILVNNIKKFSFPLHDVKPIQYAFVTGGGVDIKEINPKTLESKLINNLYFIGEILDIHGKIGGYNLTVCFMEGYCLGKYIL